METILFATKNKGKIREINAILADMGVQVVSMEEAGITIDVVEDGKTFEENAMKKAVQVMEIGQKITLADDSAESELLCIPRLVRMEESGYGLCSSIGR